MAAERGEASRGWYKLANAAKWHYFDGGTTSLCGRWMVWAFDAADLEDGDHESKHNCAACRKERARRGRAKG